MDNKFLYDARREPRPEFARNLRERLARQSAAAEVTVRPRPPAARGRLLWAAASVAAAGALFLIPAVRATAQGFLDLFRVHNFAAVTVDAARLEQLRGYQIDMKSMLGTPQVLRDPGPMRTFTDAASASGAAGYALRMPTDVPWSMQPDTILVRGESEQRGHVDTQRLRSLLKSLAIDDVEVPPALDNAEVDLRVPTVTIARYRHEKYQVVFFQAPSPEVSLPAGVDASRLGEIGLRVVGLSREDARHFAQSVDWHSTVLVPVPATASSFREVNVNGQKGLLVSSDSEGPGRAQTRFHHAGSQLMWAEGDRVYAMMSSTVSDVDLLRMANSVR